MKNLYESLWEVTFPETVKDQCANFDDVVVNLLKLSIDLERMNYFRNPNRKSNIDSDQLIEIATVLQDISRIGKQTLLESGTN